MEVLYKLPSLTYGGDEVYVVNVDGQIMYMMLSTVSDKKVQSYSSSGGGGGSSSSGGGAVWTPPAM